MMLHIRKLGENAGAHLTYKTIIKILLIVIIKKLGQWRRAEPPWKYLVIFNTSVCLKWNIIVLNTTKFCNIP